MSWRPVATHPWQQPLDFAAAFAHEDITLLHSSMREGAARYSFLLRQPIAWIEAQRWQDLPPLPPDATPNLPYFIALLGYGMGGEKAASMPRGTASPITFADATFIRYAQLFRFDHAQHILEEWAMDDAPQGDAVNHASTLHRDAPIVASIDSNFSRERYLRVVADTLEQIAAGNFYQANITRKFYGTFDNTPDYFSLFTALCEASPAPYAAYIRHGERAILSSSPECFLRIDAAGTITSCPIKGSARRDADAQRDAAIQHSLPASQKNLAENLMITDLIRHDLAQVAEVGSVRVVEQSALHSYRTIHHLISTITARKRPDQTAYDVVRACFPPGSMTGAPKIAAIRWCAAVEAMERGIYSGAIGWFGGGDSCDLSVVIRTLVVEGKQFEFQVGGGIVADSTPDEEWRETLTKARAIAQVLGIHEETLAGI